MMEVDILKFLIYYIILPPAIFIKRIRLYWKTPAPKPLIERKLTRRRVSVKNILRHPYILEEDHEHIHNSWLNLIYEEHRKGYIKIIILSILSILLAYAYSEHLASFFFGMVPFSYYLFKYYYAKLIENYNSKLTNKLLSDLTKLINMYKDTIRFYKEQLEIRILCPSGRGYLTRINKHLVYSYTHTLNCFQIFTDVVKKGERVFVYESEHALVFGEERLATLPAFSEELEPQDFFDKFELQFNALLLMTSNLLCWLGVILQDGNSLTDEYYAWILIPFIDNLKHFYIKQEKLFLELRNPPIDIQDRGILPARHPLCVPLDRFLSSIENMNSLTRNLYREIQAQEVNAEVDVNTINKVMDVLSTELVKAQEKLYICKLMVMKRGPVAELERKESKHTKKSEGRPKTAPVITISHDTPEDIAKDEEFELFLQGDEYQKIIEEAKSKGVHEEQAQVPASLMRELTAALYRRLIKKGKEPFVRPLEEEEPPMTEHPQANLIISSPSTSSNSSYKDETVLQRMKEADCKFEAAIIHPPPPPPPMPEPTATIYLDNEIIPMRLPMVVSVPRVIEEVFNYTPDYENENPILAATGEKAEEKASVDSLPPAPPDDVEKTSPYFLRQRRK